MNRSFSMRCARIAMFLFLGLACAHSALAQTGATGTLRGQVADDTGGAIPNAPVQVTSPSGQTLSVTTGRDGAYEFRDLPPGQYKLQVTVKDFAPFIKEDVNVAAGQTLQLNIVLTVAEQQEKVTVNEEAVSVDTSPSDNASSVVLTEKELEALPDDPDELQADLEALAGPSAGPNGGQMYIDGFTAGQLPPKSSIREIRINQNPFSAEFDKVGYGRIQIFTKPGTNQWHGQLSINRNQADFNSPNPFSTTTAGFDSTQLEGNVGGPLSKRASIFFNVDHRDIADQSIVVATDLDPTTFLPVAANATIPSARTRLNIGPRLDYQLTANNTLSVRYQYFYNSQTNNGIGGLDLGSVGYNANNSEHTVQISDDQVLGTKVINETRFQYLRQDDNQNPLSLLPTVTIPGAFTGGGSNGGLLADLQNHYEVQNYTSVALTKHFIRFGIRLRIATEASSSTSGFNGAFTFSSLTAYSNWLQGIGGAGNFPSQLSVTTGIPAASVTMVDAGPYVEDDWRLRPNITFSYGLRFEGQDHISNHADWAPRVALAWGLARGKATPKTVLRAGWGIFYDRFGENLILQAERQSSAAAAEQQYIVLQPSCPYSASPTLAASCLSMAQQAGSASPATPTFYQIAPNLHAPMMMQTAVTVERQLSKIANLSVSYLNSRGTDQLLSDNINSPVLPGTTIPTSIANGGVYPNGIAENIYQYQSAAIFRQNQLIMNTTIRAGAKLQLNAYYALNYANSDSSGAGFFPSNPYNLMADYGRAAFDVRSKVFFGGTVALPFGFRLSPFLTAQSGTPFSITLAQDLIGSSQFNQRPGFVSTATCPAGTAPTGTIYCTPVGTFDSAGPTGDESLLPINSLTGPGQFSLNLRLTKTFAFGKPTGGPDRPRGQGGGGPGGGGGGGGRPGGGPGGFGGGPRGLGGGGGGAAAVGRYSFTASINARNVFNNVNLATPIGTLTSSKFDQSIGLAGGGGGGGFGGAASAANRQVYLQLTFAF